MFTNTLRCAHSPESIKKSIDDILKTTIIAEGTGQEKQIRREQVDILDLMDAQEALASLKKQMKSAADRLEFEEAARLRDEMLRIEDSVKPRIMNKGKKD